MTEPIQKHIRSAIVVDRSKYDHDRPATPKTVRALIIEFDCLPHVEAEVIRVIEAGLEITIKHRIREVNGS